MPTTATQDLVAAAAFTFENQAGEDVLKGFVLGLSAVVWLFLEAKPRDDS